MDHRNIVAACETAKRAEFEFPAAIRNFTEDFATMQKRRFATDFDPGPTGEFHLPHVLYFIHECELTIERFTLADPDDRKAFAVLVMMK